MIDVFNSEVQNLIEAVDQREDEFHATQFRVPPYVVLPSRAPAIQEIAGLSPHYDQLQPEAAGESVACRQ
jgi:hypothetical protein